MFRILLLLGFFSLVNLLSPAAMARQANSFIVWNEKEILLTLSHIGASDNISDRASKISIYQLDKLCEMRAPIAQTPELFRMSFTCFTGQSPITLHDEGLQGSDLHHIAITRGAAAAAKSFILSPRNSSLRIEREENGQLVATAPFYKGLSAGFTIGWRHFLASLLCVITLVAVLLRSAYKDAILMSIFATSFVIGLSLPGATKAQSLGIEYALGLTIALRAAILTTQRYQKWGWVCALFAILLLFPSLFGGVGNSLDLAFWGGLALFATALGFSSPNGLAAIGMSAGLAGMLLGLLFTGAFPWTQITDNQIFAAQGGLALAAFAGFSLSYLVIIFGRAIYDAFRPARVNLYRDALASLIVGYGLFIATSQLIGAL